MLNQVNLIGRITKDLELKKTQANKSVLNFTLACDDGKKGDQRISQFIECQVWESLAEVIAKYSVKGDMIQVSGKLVNNNYESNGVKHYSYKVLVRDITLLPNRRNENDSMKMKDLKKDTSISDEFYQPSLGGDVSRPEERDFAPDDLPFY